MGCNARNPVFGDLRTTKAQTRCLISIFVICILESITFRFATSEISIFYLRAAAEETGLSLACSETSAVVIVKAHMLWALLEKTCLWGFRTSKTQQSVELLRPARILKFCM